MQCPAVHGSKQHVEVEVRPRAARAWIKQYISTGPRGSRTPAVYCQSYHLARPVLRLAQLCVQVEKQLACGIRRPAGFCTGPAVSMQASDSQLPHDSTSRAPSWPLSCRDHRCASKLRAHEWPGAKQCSSSFDIRTADDPSKR